MGLAVLALNPASAIWSLPPCFSAGVSLPQTRGVFLGRVLPDRTPQEISPSQKKQKKRKKGNH